MSEYCELLKCESIKIILTLFFFFVVQLPLCSEWCTANVGKNKLKQIITAQIGDLITLPHIQIV